MQPKPTPEARMRAIFAALARGDIDELATNWAEDGVYFSPTVGPRVEGKPAIKHTIATMSAGLIERGEVLVIDRVTEIADASPVRAYVEWHVESGNARNGKLGLHLAEFNEDGLLQNAIVFAHA